MVYVGVVWGINDVGWDGTVCEASLIGVRVWVCVS